MCSVERKYDDECIMSSRFFIRVYYVDEDALKLYSTHI